MKKPGAVQTRVSRCRANKAYLLAQGNALAISRQQTAIDQVDAKASSSDVKASFAAATSEEAMGRVTFIEEYLGLDTYPWRP
jgi:hypothetical protein